MINKRFAFLLSLLLVASAWAYEGGIIKNHNHTSSAGDGGVLSNLSVTGTISASTQHLGVDASTTTPSYSFTNDTVTGMFRSVPAAVTFSSTAITTGNSNSTINIPNHGLYDTYPVLFTSTGTAPAGLVIGTTYFVLWVDVNDIALSTTSVNAANGARILLGTQGSGIHTLTPVPAHDIGIANSTSGQTMWLTGQAQYGGTTVSSAQVFLGGRTQPTQPSEAIHVEGTGNTASDYSEDVAIYNSTGACSRFVASSGNYGYTLGVSTPAGVAYLQACGKNPGINGTYWSGGPAVSLTADLELQSNGTNFFQLLQDQPGQNIYLWSQNGNPNFVFCEGATCASMATIHLAGVTLGNWSLSQLKTLVTSPGDVDYCSNCATDAVCVATGTLNSFVRVSARGTSCQ